MMGELLQAVPRTDILDRRPSIEGSAGERLGRPRGSSGDAAAAMARTLQNQYRVDWRPGFEAPDEAPAPGSPLSAAAATVEEQCGEPGRLATTQESILIDVLTLGPPRSMQHALVKFVGKRGKELGQGVVCVGELLTGSGGISALSRCSSREDVRRSSPPPASAVSSSGPVASKHKINLQVGGHLKGTVEFELAIKAKRRTTREGAVLRETLEEARAGGGGSGGSGGGGRG
jgi:hypothetical protein